MKASISFPTQAALRTEGAAFFRGFSKGQRHSVAVCAAWAGKERIHCSILSMSAPASFLPMGICGCSSPLSSLIRGLPAGCPAMTALPYLLPPAKTDPELETEKPLVLVASERHSAQLAFRIALT